MVVEKVRVVATELLMLLVVILVVILVIGVLLMVN
jgi:hypothetical protein